MVRRYELNDDQYALSEPHLPARKGKPPELNTSQKWTDAG